MKVNNIKYLRISRHSRLELIITGQHEHHQVKKRVNFPLGRNFHRHTHNHTHCPLIRDPHTLRLISVQVATEYSPLCTDKRSPLETKHTCYPTPPKHSCDTYVWHHPQFAHRWKHPRHTHTNTWIDKHFILSI